MGSGEFALWGTTGQADAGTGMLAGGGRILLSGFWSLYFLPSDGVVPSLHIRRDDASGVVVSWFPDTLGFVLQESASLASDSWVTLSPHPENPVSLPTVPSRGFFRLIRP